LNADQYIFQKLSQATLHHLVGLYHEAFGKKVAFEFLARKYDTQKFGAAYIGYLAFTSAGQPAAFYGVLPCIVHLNGQRILAAQSADTMTHPDHRQKGLFTALAKKTYSLAKENNIKFIFGFPNQNSFPGFVKLNWQFMPEPMKLFSIRVKTFPAATVFSKSLFLSGLYQQTIDFFYSRKRNREELFSMETADHVLHDSFFLAYKQYSRTSIVKIGESYVWGKWDGALKVGYAQFPDDLPAEIFIRNVKQLAAQTGCTAVFFMTCATSRLYKKLSSLMTPADALPIGFYPLSDDPFDFEKIEFEYCDIDIF
jgi:GNAT superfamily N-acetyltransferase